MIAVNVTAEVWFPRAMLLCDISGVALKGFAITPMDMNESNIIITKMIRRCAFCMRGQKHEHVCEKVRKNKRKSRN